MYSIVDSQKGSKVIRFQDNLYRLQKHNKNGSIRWICTNRYCSSSITIRNQTIENQRGQHNHDKVKRSASIMNAFKHMRQEVRNDVGKPVTQIYTEFVSEYRHINGTAESVPIFDTIRSTLYRDRSTVLPKHPRCIRDLIVPDYFMKNLYDEMMLFCDQRIPTRILAFCSLSALKELDLVEDLKKEDIKRQVANILSLPLLPPNEINRAFKESYDMLLSVNVDFLPFFKYVKKTYIVNARFNSSNWNHYSTLTDRPRTNNHRLIAKPNIWKWIMQIRKDDEQTIIRLEQEKKQNRSTRPRKRKNIVRDICLSGLKTLSTPDKTSYHVIHANPTLLFENNIMLGVFIKNFIHLLLLAVIQHKCTFVNIDDGLPKSSISDLIKIISPHIATLRSQCVQCYLPICHISVSQIAHLVVMNKTNTWTLAIDLSVYSKNQQFRLFDCIKMGKHNVLHQSTIYPFCNQSEIAYRDILTKSLTTYNPDLLHLPQISFINNQFHLEHNNSSHIILKSENIVEMLQLMNYHFITYFSHNTNSKRPSSSNESQFHCKKFNNRSTSTNLEPDQYRAFVQKLITSDPNHSGYIYSCVSGDYNRNLLFFNITGNFRYCPRKGDHHKRNSVTIIIDTRSNDYTIRCKDSECNNTKLTWTPIK
ncbi:unnamed protein product [Adineta ricciae]|uniref:DNA-directed primase/polymerase protein n=1 Tax=Adineta ricciae TaxID=249248 RepID=A0A815JBN8_ADIRI|nr:unnamed protein product [Adineta ricciae]